MDLEKMIEQAVGRSLDGLAVAGEAHAGLWPNLMHMNGRGWPASLPEAIPGQRDGDRPYAGCNPLHDFPALEVAYAMGGGQAADRYLRTFATRCTDTPSGLFPWGEHSFWDLVNDRVGNCYVWTRRAQPATHDRLRQAPRWLWEKLDAFNPDCVQRYARGLQSHYRTGEPSEYIRHAPILKPPAPTGPRGDKSADFPRHGGFYIADWAFAYSRHPDPWLLEQIANMMAYWWPKRDEKGLLPLHTRVPEGDKHDQLNQVTQTLSLGLSLLEAAEWLPGNMPLQAQGEAYGEAFLALPHDPRAGHIIAAYRRDTGETLRTFVPWGSKYGLNATAAGPGLLSVGYFRQTRKEAYLDFAETVGRMYRGDVPDSGDPIPAKDPGLTLELLAALYEETGEQHWLDTGFRLAENVLALYFDENLPLPRAATGLDHYEAQLMPSYLLHGLARLLLLSKDRKQCPLQADFSQR